MKSFLFTAACLVATSFAAQDNETAYKPVTVFANHEDMNVYVNHPWKEFKEVYENTDQLLLYYVGRLNFQDQAKIGNWLGLEQLSLDVLQKIGTGYIQTYYYDCEWIERGNKDDFFDTRVCQQSEDQFNPQFLLIKPPLARINPYDGLKIQSELVPFPSNQIDFVGYKKWIMDNIPDYTKTLMSQSQFYSFAQKDEGKISKLYLLSGKQKAPQSVGALSAIFRDRIDFGFINDDSVASKALKQTYPTVQKAPAVLLIDFDGNQQIYTGAMKVPEMSEWLAQFALKSKLVQDSKTESQNFKKSEWQQIQTAVTVSDYEQYTEKVLKSDKQTLIYFASENDLPHFATMKDFVRQHGEYIQCVWYNVVDEDNVKEHFKSVYKGKPIFATVSGKEGDRMSTLTQIKTPVLEEGDQEAELRLMKVLEKEIRANYVADFRQLIPSMITQYTQDADHPKYIVSYAFDATKDDQQPELAYVALSQDVDLQRDFEFFVQNMDEDIAELNNLETLPSLLGYMRKDDKYSGTENFNFNGLKKIEYRQVKNTLLSLLKDNQTKQQQRAQQQQQQEPSMKKIDRNIVEITNQKQLQERCYERNFCGLVLLDASINRDYDLENHQKKLDMLQKLAERGDKRGSPVIYSWLDVNCHPEALSWFDLSSFNVPTVLYYQPKHNRVVEMVGAFDYDTIREQEDKMTSGLLRTREMTLKHQDMVLNKECQVVEQPEQTADDDDDEEFQAMLAEILAEEEARQAEVEEETKSKSAKSGKKVKKSSKKKGKKGQAKDEL